MCKKYMKEKYIMVAIFTVLVAALSLFVLLNSDVAKEEREMIKSGVEAKIADKVKEQVVEERYERKGEEDVFEGLGEKELEEKLPKTDLGEILGAGNVNIYALPIGTCLTDEEFYQATTSKEIIKPLIDGTGSWTRATTTYEAQVIGFVEFKTGSSTCQNYSEKINTSVEWRIADWKNDCIDRLSFEQASSTTWSEETGTSTETFYTDKICDKVDCSSEDVLTVCTALISIELESRIDYLQDLEILKTIQKHKEYELDQIELPDNGNVDISLIDNKKVIVKDYDN